MSQHNSPQNQSGSVHEEGLVEDISSHLRRKTDFMSSPYSIFHDVLDSRVQVSQRSESDSSISPESSPEPSSIATIATSYDQSNSLKEKLKLPGSLHMCSDSALESLITRYGAISVIKQLANDLKDTKSVLDSAKSKADDQVRLLSRMLNSYGVSQYIINSKLEQLDRKDASSEQSTRQPSASMTSSSSLALSNAYSSSADGSKGSTATITSTPLSQSQNIQAVNTTASLEEPLKPVTFRRTARPLSVHNKEDIKLDGKMRNGSASKDRTLRKSKSTFRIPFFWKADDLDQPRSDENEPPSSSEVNSESVSQTNESRMANSSSIPAIGPFIRPSSAEPTRRRQPFSTPLFPEENTLPPLIATESKSMIRNNVNNFSNQVTERTIQASTRRRQHIVNASFERADDDGPINEDSQIFSSNTVVDSVTPSSSSDDNDNDAMSFKSAVQSHTSSPETENLTTPFPSSEWFEKYREKRSASGSSSGLKSSPSVRANGSFSEEESNDRNSSNRKSRFEAATFMIPFRKRSRSRSRGSSRSNHSSYVGENVPEWLPHSLKESSTQINSQMQSIADRVPVELGDIVPQNIQPPTLLQSWNDHYRSEDTFLLTDRFGFIYDGQHQPVLPIDRASAKLMDFDGAESSEFSEMKSGGGRQGIPIPIPSLMSALPLVGNIARVGGSNERKASLDTVKVLLSQLTDLHDSLQRSQRARWDEFLRRINGEGSDESPLAIENGELFGINGRALIANKQNGRAKFKEFKALVLGGIPVIYRSKIWSECSGADSLRVPGIYEELINAQHDHEAVQQIELDLYRTMPTNVFFGGKGPGVQKLRRVLLAFSKRNPTIGYCQGMNMIAATLLLTYATEDSAFWSFVSLIENILPTGYFDPPLLTSRADQRVLKQYLKELQPKLYNHLEDLGVDIEAITFNWFLSCFTDCLPAEVLFRIWDVFLCLEGEVYLFRVALSLFRIFSKLLMRTKSAASVYSLMKDMAAHPISIEGLIRLSDSLKHQVRLDDMRLRRKAEIRAMQEQFGF
ncbi:rab-GTPase-TBC domain-containing protein [Dipodascopsis uninucleata]